MKMNKKASEILMIGFIISSNNLNEFDKIMKNKNQYDREMQLIINQSSQPYF